MLLMRINTYIYIYIYIYIIIIRQILIDTQQYTLTKLYIRCFPAHLDNKLVISVKLGKQRVYICMCVYAITMCVYINMSTI